MKNFAYLALVLSAFSANYSFATETENNVLIPATTLEEMMNDEADATVADANLDLSTRADWGWDGGRGDRRDHRRGVVCTAQNRRGMRFVSRGFSPRDTQEQAMSECYQRGSRRCYPMGCRRL